MTSYIFVYGYIILSQIKKKKNACLFLQYIQKRQNVVYQTPGYEPTVAKLPINLRGGKYVRRRSSLLIVVRTVLCLYQKH